MKTVIIYKTKAGSTQEYAEYIHKNLPGSEIFDMDLFEENALNDYDLVIVGARTYMGQIQARDFLVKNWDFLKTKDVYLYTVGMIDALDPESQASFKSIPEEIRNNIRFIKVPGRVKEEGLNMFEIMLAKTKKLLNKDKVNYKAILPVIDYARSKQ